MRPPNRCAAANSRPALRLIIMNCLNFNFALNVDRSASRVPIVWRKRALPIAVLALIFAVYWVLFNQSFGREMGAAMSSETGPSSYDQFVQSVLSFPFFYFKSIFSLPLDVGLLVTLCTTLNGMFWSIILTVPVVVITRQVRHGRNH